MHEFSLLILSSGKAAVELALFILLPVMVVMLSFMRLMEAWGVLDRVVSFLTPLLLPLGIPGIGVFAMIQILLVSFAGPVATLRMMDKGGISSRHIAATLSMVLVCAQANVVFPMTAVGLDGVGVLLISAACGLVAGCLTYYLFARGLDDVDSDHPPEPSHPQAEDTLSILSVINRAGKEAFEITIGAIPMLILALLLVGVLKSVGLIALMEPAFMPLFNWVELPTDSLLAIFTKYIAGGTAMMGVAVDLVSNGQMSLTELNRVSGFLIHPLDIVGIAVLISAGPRVSRVLRPALFGAICAIVLRTLIHFLVY